jgi:YidC/Oxa1 family membrane protein insertase
MPPPGSDAAKAKAAADRPAVDPRTLAPKPGAKPVRPKGGRPVSPPAVDATPSADGGSPNGRPSTEETGDSGSAAKTGQSPPNRGKRKRR